MFNNLYRLLPVIMMMAACGFKNEQSGSTDVMTAEIYGNAKMALSSNNFKIPVPQGYDWEITQSWGEHCEQCDKKYPVGTSFCKDSHNTEYAMYGWDFNLADDLGKSVLASANGKVKAVKNGKDFYGKYIGGDWGNTILIDHGNNICTRYAHLKDDSIKVTEPQLVCQGLKIGEIGKTGNVTGAHLHFQFENCENHEPLPLGFTDGNGIPECTMGKDIKTNGVYTALKLTNVEKNFCDADESYQQPIPPSQLICENKGPYNNDCQNKGQAASQFSDLNVSDQLTYPSINYLWRECAFGGKKDGLFHEDELLTRAEALKTAMVLFGLTKGCEGTKEPFSDVNPGEWFYTYVVCGVKHGVIGTANSTFKPDTSINFAEAAKIAVEAAVKSGKRKIVAEAGFKFKKIPKGHWAYKYLQTIASFGGINTELFQKYPDGLLLRGQFARMIAALSTCFCQKNDCGEGCECNQASYICQTAEVSKDKDPGDGDYAGGPGGGTGQGDVENICLGTEKDACGSADAGTEKDAGSNSCVPYCNSGTWECGDDGCGGDCGPCASGMFCEGSYRKCYPICQFQSCAELGCECGTCGQTGPGCSGLGSGCGSCPSGKICSSDNKCQSDPCYNCPSGKCVNGQCQFDINNWKCDSTKLYSFKVTSEGGEWESSSLLPWSDDYSNSVKWSMDADYPSSLIGSGCYQLPKMILIKGGSKGVKLLVEDNTLPPLEIWQPYSGSLTFSPATSPTLTTYSVDTSTPNLTMLVRMRAPICTTTSCPTGKICVSGQCKMDPCLKCGAGTICVNGKCQTDACLKCPPGYDCFAGKWCIPPFK